MELGVSILFATTPQPRVCTAYVCGREEVRKSNPVSLAIALETKRRQLKTHRLPARFDASGF